VRAATADSGTVRLDWWKLTPFERHRQRCRCLPAAPLSVPLSAQRCRATRDNRTEAI